MSLNRAGVTFLEAVFLNYFLQQYVIKCDVITGHSSLYWASKYVYVMRVGLGPVVLHGCETWSVTLREEHRLRVLEYRLLRKLFWPKWDEVTGGGEGYIKRSCVLCTSHQILFGWSNKED